MQILVDDNLLAFLERKGDQLPPESRALRFRLRREKALDDVANGLESPFQEEQRRQKLLDDFLLGESEINRDQLDAVSMAESILNGKSLKTESLPPEQP